MEKQKNNSIIIALLIVIIVILTILCVLFATNTITFKSNASNNSQDASNAQSENKNTNGTNVPGNQTELGAIDTFSASTESGIVEVIGYPEIKEKTYSRDNYEGSDEKPYYYIYFHIKETKSTEFKKFIDDHRGNAFVSEDAIGIGCNSDGKITYFNASDMFGGKNYELSKEDSDKILNATENNPVRLKLEKLVLSDGTDAPICYSFINSIVVID